MARTPMDKAVLSSLIEQAANEFGGGKLRAHGIDLAKLLECIVARESGGVPDAKGAAGEIGLTQLWPKGAIAAWEGAKSERVDYWDPRHNLRVSAWFLGQHLRYELERRSLPVTVRNLAIAYNGGIGRVLDGKLKPVTVAYAAFVEARYAGATKAEAVQKAAEAAVPVVKVSAGVKIGAWATALTALFGLLRAVGVIKSRD